MIKFERVFLLLFCVVLVLLPSHSVFAFPQKSIQIARLDEKSVKELMVKMLIDHITYAQSIYVATDAGGYFGTGNSNEYGIRTSADYALMYAFLFAKFPDATFAGIPRNTLRYRAIGALKSGYLNHVSDPSQNLCHDNKKWGHHWQSSYWAAAYGLAVWLLWDHNNVEAGTLDSATYKSVKKMLVDEANFSISNDPSRLVKANEYDDTKAEENAWNTQILALVKSQFSSEPNAPVWDDKMKSFAMNSYGTAEDEKDNTLVDGKAVATWVVGANVHPDYTLENHGIFHPWYQTCVLTLLTESALFYKKAGLPIPGSLSHNVMNTWNNVIKKILVADGEFAYTNGCDWAMHVYSTGLAGIVALATYYRDVDASFFESRLVQYQRARQLITGNGKFVTDPAVDQERNGVIAHALVFSYLMHDYWGASSDSTSWNVFEAAQKTTKLFPYSGVIRGMNQNAYTGFSWSNYFMGTFMPRSENYLDDPYVTFPFRKGNTGNITGYFNVNGKFNNAVFQSCSYSMKKNAYATTGYIQENFYRDPVKKTFSKPALDHFIAFAQTPGNAVVYFDKVFAKDSIAVKEERGISTGIVTDPICGNSRTLYYQDGSQVVDGKVLVTVPGNWVNVDRKLGMVMAGNYAIRFGERELTNSVYVSKLYGSYNKVLRDYTAGQVVTSRNAILYSNIDEVTTASLASDAKYPACDAGWMASAVKDPDGRRFLVAANLNDSDLTPNSTSMTISYNEGAPVLESETIVTGTSGSTIIRGAPGTVQLQEMGCYVAASPGKLLTVQGDTPYQLYIKNPGKKAVTATFRIWNSANNGAFLTGSKSIEAGKTYLAQIAGGAVSFSIATYPGNYRRCSDGKYPTATSHEGGNLPLNVMDGDVNTSWISGDLPTTTAPQYLTMDLHSSYFVDRVIVKPEIKSGPKELVVEVSADGSFYTVVSEQSTTRLSNSDPSQPITFRNVAARYVRLKITSSYSTINTQIREYEVYGQ